MGGDLGEPVTALYEEGGRRTAVQARIDAGPELRATVVPTGTGLVLAADLG